MNENPRMARKPNARQKMFVINASAMAGWRYSDGTPRHEIQQFALNRMEPGAQVRWAAKTTRKINGRRVAVRETFVGIIADVYPKTLDVVTCDEAPRLIRVKRSEVVA